MQPMPWAPLQNLLPKEAAEPAKRHAAVRLGGALKGMGIRLLS